MPNVRSVSVVPVGVGALMLGLALSGCASLFQSLNSSGSSGSSSAAAGPAHHTGPITVTNQTPHAICKVEVYTMPYRGDIVWNRFDLTADPIASGETQTVPVAQQVDRIRFTECGGTHVLWDSFNPQLTAMWDEIETTTGRYTLVPSGTQVNTGGDLTLVMQHRAMNDYRPATGNLPDPTNGRLLEVTRQNAGASFASPIRWAIMQSNDFDITRNGLGQPTHRDFNVYAGIDGPDGKCWHQIITMRQQFDGSSWGPVNLTPGRSGARLQLPCEVHGAIGGGSSPGGAPSPAAPPAAGGGASPSGGRCENTCRTSNDGECDDGGPNSLYSICALGTDCNDCGPR
jgi:hypothetical protein